MEAADQDALALAHAALDDLASETNGRITVAALAQRKDFFDTIETQPLTDEQATAVLTMDNRVQVVAAAGSGKTSVMVARAAYAVRYHGIPAKKVLLLAFNRDAAQQLQTRIEARLGAAGIDANDLRASTFHAFGLNVIGRATGRKPRLAGWLDGGQDVGVISRIVDELRDNDLGFRFRWDMYRLLFAAMSEDAESSEPDAYDKDTRTSGYRTMNGEVVKSEGERLVANWLFLNGISYEYERPYCHDTATAQHSQYRPDFYYPELDVWHEHWALDRHGRIPESFVGYGESMAWKRETHQRYGTTLIETTWAEIINRSGFQKLHDDLAAHGASFDWNPERASGAEPLSHEDLARLVRTFMAHVKSNGLTREDLAARLAAHGGSYRSRVFLDIYWPIHEAWQARLRAADAIDFEDMLIDAAQALENGYDPGYDMVLVDEFQDASPGRARLVKALLQRPHRYLMTVGDDWQAINRFAGADISVMTDFNTWFGPGPTLRLQTTFRCTQTIADTAAHFVRKNPRQIAKVVRSIQPEPGEPVSLIRLASPSEVTEVLEAWLQDLASKVDPAAGRVRVDVLGRYRSERDLLPEKKFEGLEVGFRTVHSSKGLEADHVIVPGMLSATMGFPSQIKDDPVLQLVMSAADAFPHGEERRLFYVALTRARRTVTLMTVEGRESAFVSELVHDRLVEASPFSTAEPAVSCPVCRHGTMRPRTGPYGDFLGCSRFPQCRHTQKVR